MSDTTLNRFCAMGTTAQRLAFIPNPPTPASGPDNGYVFFDTDLVALYAWDGASWVATGGGGGGFTNPMTTTGDIITAGSGGIPLRVGIGTALQQLRTNAGATSPEWFTPNTPVAVAYNAGNFTGSGSLTWTVDNADQVTFKYVINGKLMTVFFQIDNTTITGAGAACQIAIPGGFTAGSTLYGSIIIQDAGVWGISQIQVAGGTTIYVYKDFNGTNWTGGTNNNSIRGQFTFNLA
jgi:hypothetical protein